MGEYWQDSIVGSVIHEHFLDLYIKNTPILKLLYLPPSIGFQKRMKVFKKSGHKATVKEVDKNLNVIDMLPEQSITHAMMKLSLAYLMFLKRKMSGLVKARGCADSRSQQEYITELESSSPCVKEHALFLSYIVDAFENRCLVIADIPAAFLSVDWPADKSDCYIRFEGAILEMLCQIKPEYQKFIRYTKMRNGHMRKLLIGKITKAIYGTLLGAILFYKKK